MKLQAVREVATICALPVTLNFDLESGDRVTCDVALYANFSLPRTLCSRLSPMYATDSDALTLHLVSVAFLWLDHEWITT